MSKAVTTDHEFRIDEYASLLLKAQGGRTQTEFANDCGLSVAYICKHLNKRITKSPIPSTLKKIAAVAANGVTYADLLDAAGYNPDKYVSGANNVDENNSSSTKNLEYEKLAPAIITTALTKSNINWRVKGKSNGNTSYDLDVEIADNKISHWYFSFLSTAPEPHKSEVESFLNRMYAYYGRLILLPSGITTKYSFVTDSTSIYDALKDNQPTAAALYISVILIDIPTLSVIKEECIRTALSDNAADIVTL